MNTLRFLILMGLSAGAHAYLMWAVVVRHSAELPLPQGEVCVTFALAAGGLTPVDRPTVPDEEKRAEALSPPVPAPTQEPPRQAAVNLVAEVLPLPMDDLALLEYRVLSERLPYEAVISAHASSPATGENRSEPRRPEVRAVAEEVKTGASGAPSTPRVQGVRSRASLIGNPRPAYPREAHLRGIQGTVTVWLHIGSNGKVIDAGVHRSSGSSILDEAAVSWARFLTLRPAQQGDQPVESHELLPVEFHIFNR
jgi:TonB family protein